MPNNYPIGFFDSGLGGISVLHEAVRLLPHENFIYFGDDANAPYGSRPEAEIHELSMRAVDFLAQSDAKAIVVACNTATSISICSMRDVYGVPIISIEPAVKPAAEAFASGTIAVLATPATLRQGRFHALVDRLGVRERVRLVACPELAGLIEAGDLQAPVLREYIRERLSELRDEDAVEALVIGCTHYSFVSAIISEEAPRLLHGACRVFDGAAGTARQLRRVLSDQDLLTTRRTPGRVVFHSSGGTPAVARMQEFFYNDTYRQEESNAESECGDRTGTTVSDKGRRRKTD